MAGIYRKDSFVEKNDGIEAILAASRNFDIAEANADDGWRKPLLTQAVPNVTGMHDPLAPSSIKQKVRDKFLDQLVLNQNRKSLHEEGYGPHSLRHANASALIALRVSAKEAAKHQQTSVQSLENTYVTQMISEWEIPHEIVDEQPSIVKKLLIPFVFFHSSGESCHEI